MGLPVGGRPGSRCPRGAGGLSLGLVGHVGNSALPVEALDRVGLGRQGLGRHILGVSVSARHSV